MNTEALRVVLREAQADLGMAQADLEWLQREVEAATAKAEDLHILIASLTRRLDDAPEDSPLPPIHEAVQAMLEAEPRLRKDRDEVIRRLAVNYKEFRDMEDKNVKRSASLYMTYAGKRIGGKASGNAAPPSDSDSEGGIGGG